MKRSKTSSRGLRSGDRRPFTRLSAQVRRRATVLRLESLEERTLLSTTKGPLPQGPTLPVGLGTTYTVLSEQAHGVSTSTKPSNQFVPGSGSTSTSSNFTMADFNAYLKQLKLSLDQVTGQGTQTPGSAKAQKPAPGPNTFYADNQDNPQQESQPVYSVNDPDALLARLKLDPNSSGYSTPEVNPSLITGFNGMNFLDSVNGYVPPETSIAVGNQYVIETVNAQIQFYDKTTGAALLPNTPLNIFFGQPGESPFTAVASYDDIAGRYIVAADSSAGHLLLAVSTDSNPFDGFSTYDLNINETGFTPENTRVGWNADELVVTFNMDSNSGGAAQVQVLSFATSALFSSTPPPTLTLGTNYFSVNGSSNDYSLAPATMHGAAPGSPMYFVEENSQAYGQSLLVVSATGLLSNSPSFTDTVVPVDPYTEPPLANEPGGTLYTIDDSSILNVDYRDGLLVAGQNIGLSTDSDVHARWYELSVSGTPSLVQDGTLSPAPGTDTYYPAVAIAPGDVIGMTYNESSLTEYPSVYDTGRTTATPKGTMQTPALAESGDATYLDFTGLGYWGDYSGIAIDPTDGSFWSGAEYSTSALSGDPANWATWISHYIIAPVVTSSNPAAGSVVTGTAPTAFSLTFSEPIDPSSITAGNFTVDGTPASSASLSSDGLTITYTYNTSPLVTQGAESMSLPAGSVKGAGDEIGNAAFSANFSYVVTQLQVTATSPAVGSVLTVPVTDMIVQFNLPFNPYTIKTSDFQLSQGTVVSAVPLTNQAVDLKFSGITQDGSLTLTIPAGAILDNYGVGNVAFSGTYVVDIVSEPYPTPLVGQAPAGSLIYDPSVTGSIGFVGDTDTYTLPLAAGQTLSLVYTTGTGLTGTITLLDPTNKVIGTATGSGPGATVVLETAPITTAGTYSLVASGAGGTTGNYTLQAILNAVYKQATDSVNTIGTAYDLTGAFASLGTTPAADRAGVIGVLSSSPDYYAIPLSAGEAASIAVKGSGGTASVALYDGTGKQLALSTAGGGVDGIISDFVAPSKGIYYVQVTGAASLSYDLVVTRGSAFTIHGNSFDNAQPLDGTSVALGSIQNYPVPALQALDLQADAYNNIYQTDPVTGAFGSHITSPNNDGFFLFGQNMASDGNYTYYNDGYGGTGIIYKLDPTGAVVASTTGPNSFFYTGLAYLNGKLYADAPDDSNIYIYDANTLAFLGTITNTVTDSSLVGLAGDPDRGVLWAVGQTGGVGELYEIDPTTGATLKEGPDNNQGLYEQDIAYSNGELIVSDTNGSYGAGNNFLDEYDPNTLDFLQRVAPPYTYAASGLAGDGIGGSSPDWYQFNVNAGDNLVITTTTPGGSSTNGQQFINNLDPTINLYDANDNLVATATGNAADGRNDVIDFTALSSGSYRVQILGTAGSEGEYTIAVQGATGAATPFTVTSTSPAAGSYLGSQISTMTVAFSDSILLSSVSTSDFTIDGNNATGVTVLDDHDLSFTFPTTADGVHNVSISGVTSIHGTTLTPDNFSFTTDDVPPVVVSSSIANGAVLSPGNITEVVTFSKPIQPSSVSTSDIELYGEIRNTFYTPSSFSFDPTDTILTINYSHLPSDAYQFTLVAGPGNFLSLAGLPLQNNYVINFTLPVGTSTISGLQSVAPVGSLVYQSTLDNVLLGASDIDTYKLAIDPQQTLAVLVTPVTPTLTVTLTLMSPTGHVIGTATSPAPGAPAYIKGVQSSTGGTYTIKVSANGAGEYTITPTLNALLDPASLGGPPDDSIGTAQPLDPYANTFIANADRTAVLGTIGGSPVQYGDAIVVESSDVILINRNTGKIVEKITSPAFSGLLLFDAALAPDNTFYVLADENFYTGVIIHLNLEGQTLGEITVPVTDNPGYLSPEGFGLDPRDGSFWIALINSGNVVHIDSSGNLLGEYYVGGSPDDVAVGPDGLIYISQIFSGYIETLTPSTGATAYFASSPFPIDLTWSVAGDLWVGDIDGGAEQFNSSGTLIQSIPDSGATAAEPAPSGNIWDANVFTALVNQFTSTGTLLTQTHFTPEQPGLAVLGDVPNEAPLAPPQYPVYSINLAQGQSASFIIDSLNSDNVSLTLLDDNGDVLAYGSTGATNYTQGINNFVASSAGTYYVQVNGDPGAKFNLVVTRNADFNTNPNNSIATAQPFNGNDAILGAITEQTAPIYTLDDNLYNPPFPIWATNPNNGTFIPPSIPAPATTPNNPYGLNMAYDGTDLYYNNGSLFGDNTIYKINPSTGKVIAQATPPSSVPLLTGIAYLNGELYGISSFDTNLYLFDPKTLAFQGTLATGIGSNYATEGLAGDPDRDVLWAVAQGAPGTIFQLDPTTGAIIKSGPDQNGGLNEQDIAYQGNQLFISDTNGLASSGGTNVIDVYDANTLAFLRRMPVNVQGFVSGLAGDGLGTAPLDDHYYSILANAGDKLHFATSTPAGGPNEFVNNLDPELELYDPNGNLVAVASGNAPDGRNSVIDFTVPAGDSGKWTIEILSSPNTSTPTYGEFGLVATGATGGLVPFTVTTTNPANGALVQPPTDYIVTFNQPVLGTSLSPGELTINGVPATAVTLVNANTVDWTIDPTSIPPGNRVLNTAVISVDPSTGLQVSDISGALLATYTSTFTTDTVPPSVVSSSIKNGQVFSPAPANITEVVTFSEPMNTSVTTASSFDLYGQYRNEHIAAASYSWDPTGTVLTINYTNVPDDVYTLTLFASGFQDLVGHPLVSDYTVKFSVALGTAAFPTPFKSVPPLGDLIYTGSDSHVLVTPTDVDSLTLALNAGESLTLIGTPSSSAQQLVITVLGPGNKVVATATAAAAGQNTVIENAAAATTGTYTIQIKDARGRLGLYSIEAYLNSYVKQGTSNLSIGTAQDISGSSYVLGSGNADRLAVVGSLPPGDLQTGDLFVVSQGVDGGNSSILEINEAGTVLQTIPITTGLSFTAGGVELSPYNNKLYVGITTSDPFSNGLNEVTGELLEFDPETGKQIGTVSLPPDKWINGNPDYYYFYPYAFTPAADGTFWVSQPNSNNIIHVDGSGNELATYPTGNVQPYSPSVRADGQVYFTGYGPTTDLYLLDPTTGNISIFASQPQPQYSDIAGSGGVWSADYYDGAQRFDDTGNLLQTVGYYGSYQAQDDGSGNVWVSNYAYGDVFQFNGSGTQLQAIPVTNSSGLTVWGVDNPNPPAQDNQDYYKFNLTAGQSATIVAKSLNSLNVQITLVDGNGNVLATGVGGSTNVDSQVENFVAPSTGTYYVEVTGDPGVQYSLTVTRGANFDIEPNNTINTAQSLTGTNGVLGALDPGGSLVIGNSFEGVDFTGSPCGCLPPDTNATVGNNYIVETVNTEIRVYDKTTGAILMDEPLSTLFGAESGGDVYVLYDDIANRWYVSAFDTGDVGLFLTVSKDGDPLDGFLPAYDLTNLGGSIPDYPKPGFNKDAIFISYNDFGSDGGLAAIVTIDKADALSGTLVDYVTHPEAQFRAMPPAQMHGDTTGGVEWFFSTDGNDTGGDTMRVTEMTNYFSNNPTFTYTSIPVTPYQAPTTAVQPGGTWTTFPNTTTYEVQYRNGILVTAMASAVATDGFTYPKGLYYEVDVSSGTPVLIKQGVIDPGPGVSVQMPAVDIDSRGDLGFSWMEASSTEYLSMWVGSLDTQGHFSSYDVAPGGGFFTYNVRIGDYGTVVLDPTDGTTFWAANEYIGADGATDIWRTYIASFSLPPAVDNDWYSVNVAAGNSLSLQSSTPSDQGGQFINTADVNIELYNTFGNLVAVGSPIGDGRNEALFYNAPVTGQYFVHVFNNPGSSGEYFLSVNTAQYPSGDISGQVYNDLNGSGTLAPGDPGLDNWEVDVYDSKNDFVASQLSHGGGYFDIAGLAPGTYKVSEILQSGWTETQPAPKSTYKVTVTAGQTSGGYDFGNFQNVTISGMAFNDLTGIGSFFPGDPALQGWKIKLLNAAGKVVATTTTDDDGDYSFTNIGPGTYTLEEVLQKGWLQTLPASPGTYSITTTSGSNQSGLLFGNFQLVTFAGTVYNDLTGNGALDPGDPGLKGWTVNLINAITGTTIATTTTKAKGTYSFANIGPGLYTVSEVNQSGWYQTQPVNPPGTYSVQAMSGTNASSLDFGNFQLVNVTGEVYNDLNGNGTLDKGEPGLQGWTVLLLDPAGNTVATTTSDANGDYEFDSLFPGTFTVEEVLQAGWVQSQPVNPNYYQFTTQSGLDENHLNFGNYSPVTISGNVYNDLDGNGLMGSGEPGLQGWTVNLLNSSGTVLTSVVTDSNGNYSFTGIAGSQYEVAEMVQTNWVQTQPLYPTAYSFTAQSGNNLQALVFGDHASPALSPAQVIDNGQPGYSETGKWSTVVAGYNGSNRVATTVHGSKTTATATWTFSGVSSGYYDVYVTFAGASGYSTAAPYTEYDGNISLGTVDVNQSILVTQSQGLTQGSYGGVGWLDLGTVSVTSGVFSAVLSNLASGNRVDADGVLLVADSGPAALVNPPLSSGSAGTNANLVGFGALDLGTSPPSTTGNSKNSSQVITLNGVSQPAAFNVVYDQGTQPVVNQASPTLVDTVIGLGSSSNANGASSNATITSLAQDIISSKKSS